MGVTAALSIAIVVDEKLWGLYAFHSHTGPVRPSVEERIMFEMIGSITSVKINAFESDHLIKLKSDMNRINRCLQNQSDKKIRDFLDMNAKDFLHILDAHAVILYYPDGSKSSFGDESILPHAQGVERLLSMSIENALLPVNWEGLAQACCFTNTNTPRLLSFERAKFTTSNGAVSTKMCPIISILRGYTPIPHFWFITKAPEKNQSIGQEQIKR
jgi:hypothetical protein